MNNKERLNDIKRYREITKGLRDKVSTQSDSFAKGAYMGSLEKLKEEVNNGCGKELWCADLYGYIPKCGIDGHTCKDCDELIKEIDALLGNSEEKE